MTDDYIECPQVSGKTIQALRIYKDTGDGTELLIDLTDGTSFSYSVCCQSAARATLYKGGVGTPEVLFEHAI